MALGQFVSRLLGRPGIEAPKMDQARARQVCDAAKKVANAYGVTLAQESSWVRNVSELPYPTDIIKKSLRVFMNTTLDHAELSQLEVAYVSLATFQVLSAAESQSLHAWHNVLVSTQSIDGDALAKSVVSVRQGAMSAQARVVAEMKALRQELQSIGIAE